MKDNIHPQWYPNASVTCACGNTWTTGATQKEIRTDICSACHPFYTGEQRIVDTEGQVDRFMLRLQRREAIIADQTIKEEKAIPTNLEVGAMALGTRAEKALEDANLTTVGDVLALLNEGDDALLALPGISQKALIDIKRFLRAEGLIE